MHLPAGYLATINSLVPLITVCIRRVFFGTIPTKKTGFAVLIGTLGVILVVGLGPLRFSEEIFIACFASIGAAICYSLSGIFVIHFFKNESLIQLYKNFNSGMIEKYLQNKYKRDSMVPILQSESISN